MVKTRVTIQLSDEEICFAPATAKMLGAMPEDEQMALLLEASSFLTGFLVYMLMESAAAMDEGEGETRH